MAGLIVISILRVCNEWHGTNNIWCSCKKNIIISPYVEFLSHRIACFPTSPPPKQHLYFFLGNSIHNKSVIDLAKVTDELNKINGKIENIGDIDLSAYATVIALNGVSDIANAAMPKSGGSFTGGVFENIIALTSNDINCTNGNYFSKTITANTTFSFSGVPSGKGACVSLVLTNGGNYTVTWPTNLKWAEGTPPELTSGGTDVLTFMTIDGGTTWYGSLSITAAA